MNSKEQILSNIRKNIGDSYQMPEINISDFISFDNKIKQFIEISKGVGGDIVELEKGQDITEIIRKKYPKAKIIASNLNIVNKIVNLNPDNIDNEHDLKDVDISIIKGELGVAENGAIWIPLNVRHKALYFIPEYLIIVLEKDKIVNNMHEAYSKIDLEKNINFGVFISGPSKTADIEQALVLGAHGAKETMIILV